MREKKLVIVEIVIWTIVWLLVDRISRVAADIMVDKTGISREEVKVRMQRFEMILLLIALAVAMHFYYMS